MNKPKEMIIQEQLTEAKQLMNADREYRAQECRKAIEAALGKYKCDLLAQPVITEAGALTASVQVVALVDQ